MARTTIVIALPREEREPIESELRAAGYDTIGVASPAELVTLLERQTEVAMAILDGESNFADSLECYSILHEDGVSVPTLMIVSPRTLERLEATPSKALENDEYFTRPYSVESLRWRVEAMCIRSRTVDDGSGPVLQSGEVETGAWARRGTVVAVFNPKGGVGKTTVATNLAAALQVRKNRQVMLVDADVVTGHVATSLGIEQVRTVADAWRDEAEGAPPESLVAISAIHGSGVAVATLSRAPLDNGILDPARVSSAIAGAARAYDLVVVDLHPSYGPLNQALFELSDKILVPVTPDVPAIRAAIQLREIAGEMGVRDRLAMVVNRANSGVSVADMEKTVGMSALALIRSGGLLFVRAANEGRSVVEMFPREKITEDFDALADTLLGTARKVEAPAGRSLLRLLARSKEPVQA